MKKVLSVILAMVLIVMMCPLTSSAETTDIFEINITAQPTNPASANPNIIRAGEEITFTVSAVQNTGVDYLDFFVYYNADLFEFVDFVDLDSKYHPYETVKTFDGYVKYFTFDLEPITTVGNMFKFKLKAINNACGDVLTYAILKDANSFNCAITVNGEAVSVPFVSNKYEADIHNITAEGVVKKATCVDGYTSYTCNVCNRTDIKGNITPAVDEHKGGEATCSNKAVCTVCNLEYGVINVNNHKNTELREVLAENCCDNGYTGDKWCKDCETKIETGNVIPATGNHGSTIHSDGYFKFTVSDNEATITGYSEDISGKVTIPATLGGFKVTGIGRDAFLECEKLEGIVIPEGVESIGFRAFMTCRNLVTIDIPSTVVSIGNWAFLGCVSLEEVNIPNGINKIGESVFMDCLSLKSITIPTGVTRIGNNAFNGSTELKDVYYLGTKEGWNAITIDNGNDILDSATLHCSMTGLKLDSVSLSLENYLLLNYKIDKKAIADNGYEKAIIKVNFAGKEVTVSDYTEDGDYLVFSVKCENLSQAVKATVFGVKNDQNYMGEAILYGENASYKTDCDFNSNGEFDSFDETLLNILVKGTAYKEACDINGDTKTDIADLLRIRKLMAASQQNEKSDLNGDGVTDDKDYTFATAFLLNYNNNHKSK